MKNQNDDDKNKEENLQHQNGNKMSSTKPNNKKHSLNG